jgi:hypothetical protein
MWLLGLVTDSGDTVRMLPVCIASDDLMFLGAGNVGILVNAVYPILLVLLA